MKMLNIVLAVLFFSFVVVQYNDPDPLWWMTIYGIVTAVCALAAANRYYRWLILAGLAVCVIEMAITIPGFVDWINRGMPNIVETMKAEKPYIEYSREFFGLILCIGTLVFQYIQARRTHLPR